eukprot:scaffold4477_cov417-Prasinococcus_capsulatus_cf.AAC.2
MAASAPAPFRLRCGGVSSEVSGDVAVLSGAPCPPVLVMPCRWSARLVNNGPIRSDPRRGAPAGGELPARFIHGIHGGSGAPAAWRVT